MAWIRTAGEVLREYRTRMERRAAELGPEGVASGFASLDEATGGFRAGTVTLLAARPGMGVSTLALSMARNAAMDHRARTLYLSTELPLDLMGRFLLSNESNTPRRNVRDWRFTPEQLQRVHAAIERIEQAPLDLGQCHQPTLDELATELGLCRRWTGEGWDFPRLVIIDSLEDVLLDEGLPAHELPDPKERRERAMQRLAAIAREHHTAMLVTVRLGRAVDRRERHFPHLSDLPYVRQVEPYVGCILILTRESYYDFNFPKGPADLLVSLNRYGPTRAVRLHFDETHARFSSHEKEGEGAGKQGHSSENPSKS